MDRRQILQGIAALFVLPYIKVKAAVKKRFVGGWVRVTREGNGSNRFYTSDMAVGKIPQEEDWVEQTDPFVIGNVEVNTTGRGYIFRIPIKNSPE